MSLFSKRTYYGSPTYNPFESPSMPLSSLALDGILGGQDSGAGETVDPVGGMAIPTAYRCISIISTIFASCALEEVDVSGAGDTARWATLDNLESYTQFELMEIAGTHLSGWGNFYSRKVKDGRGAVVDLQPIFPGAVDVKRVRGKKAFTVKRTSDSGVTDSEELTEAEVFHIPGFGFDGLKGVSPILMAARTFGTTIAADKLAGRFYAHGQQLGGIIKVKAPLANQGQADAIKHQWASSHGGVNNSGSVAVLDAETDFTPITIEPNALQFLESRQWQASEVAKMFGIPAFMVSEQTSWGAGIEQQWQGFVTMTLRSYTDRAEQRFTREFAKRGKILEFELDRLMRGSTADRYAAYGQAIGWGWMSPNEVRVKERMKTKPGLDDTLQVQSMNGALADGPLGAKPPQAEDPAKPATKDKPEPGAK